jgi:DUF4097 and DUF4098 domain-containing protein YvlB
MKSLKLAILVLMFSAIATLPLRAAETGTFDKTLSVSAPVDLEVTSGSGNIKIHTGGSGSVHVFATIRARDSWFGLSAREKVKKLEEHPPIEQQSNSIRIGRIEDRELQQNVSIDYDLTVPAQTKVSSQTGSGDQVVSGTQLAMSARTGSGNITIENIGAGVRARSGSGDLKINSVKGGLDAQTGSGNIRAHDIAGEVTANTGSGDVEVEQTAAGNAKVGTGSGTVKLHGVKGALRVETGSGNIIVDGEPAGDWRVGAGSGDIELKVPSQASFNIDAHTSSGRLNVNRPVTMQGAITRNHIQGKVGNGGVLLDLHTGSGDIRLD